MEKVQYELTSINSFCGVVFITKLIFYIGANKHAALNRA